MTIRTVALLLPILALQALPVAVAEPAGPTAGTDAPAETAKTAEPDIWPEHALPDADAARQGRSALPFTQDSRSKPWAACYARPSGRRRGARARRRKAASGVIRLDAPGAGQIPAIALRHGYTTVLSFTGLTGAPWPIAEAVLDSRFLPPGQETAPEAVRCRLAAICSISRRARPFSTAMPW